MAERRMFAKSIVTSDAFLDMPMSARCLYFTLGMFADDDGFVNNPKSIVRQIGASEDDVKVLLAKRFLLTFESGVIVIKHWRINNYLRNDRYHETNYIEEKKSLSIDENGAYTDSGMLLVSDECEDNNGELRKKVYAQSELPCSFDYKIRQAFNGCNCPICGQQMRNVENGKYRPTIQHNLPISKGGKHEIDNISVICHSCNVSIKDTPTGELNNAEVKQKWAELTGIPNAVYQGRYTEDSIGKDSIDKNSIEKKESKKKEKSTRHQIPPTVEMVKAYCMERHNTVDAEKFCDFYEMKGWMVGKDKMKDWQAAVRTWERQNGDTQTAKDQALIEKGKRAQEENERQMEEAHKAEMEQFKKEHPDQWAEIQERSKSHDLGAVIARAIGG